MTARDLLMAKAFGGGVTPTGTIEITENGTYDVTSKASAVVDVESGGGIGPVLNGTISGDLYDEFTGPLLKYRLCGCSGVTSINFPNCTSIEEYGLNTAQYLREIRLPECTAVYQYAFSYAGNSLNDEQELEVYLPKCTFTGTYAFSSCTHLKHIDLPMVKAIKGYTFRASKVETIDMGYNPGSKDTQPQIEQNALTETYYIKALILRSRNKIWTLVSSLSGSNIASGDGYVYVPSALVSSYTSATNWKTYASKIRALEDYTVDGTITGALDPEKI